MLVLQSLMVSLEESRCGQLLGKEPVRGHPPDGNAHGVLGDRESLVRVGCPCAASVSFALELEVVPEDGASEVECGLGSLEHHQISSRSEDLGPTIGNVWGDFKQKRDHL